MADFFRGLSFWRLAPNQTALTIRSPELVSAAVVEADRSTAIAYVCTPDPGGQVAGATVGLRLPNGEYRLAFLDPTDLSVMGTRTHTSHGAGDEVPVELPEFTDDLVIKLERIRETERTVIPGTQ